MDTPLARQPALRPYPQEVPTSERKSRVREALERMKIGDRARHIPQHLCGGQRQRAAITRAVLSRSKLILADELSDNRDTASGNRVMQLLTELNADATTVVWRLTPILTPNTPIESSTSWTVPSSQRTSVRFSEASRVS